jgi:excisionase family DNA binding protein
MVFHIAKGDKSMLEITQTNELSYKSTRETAKILQVSLGTIQKMVETGELIAWKTRGGHRRILDLSIERQLAKRHELLRHFCSKSFSILGIFSQTNDIINFENHCRDLESRITCHSYIDISEALMAAVALKPEIIFIDQRINPIDQYHLMHQFNKNSVTCTIPILTHENTIQNHPKENELNHTSLNSSEVNSPLSKGKIYVYSDSLGTIEDVIKKALVEQMI